MRCLSPEDTQVFKKSKASINGAGEDRFRASSTAAYEPPRSCHKEQHYRMLAKQDKYCTEFMNFLDDDPLETEVVLKNCQTCEPVQSSRRAPETKDNSY